MNLPDGSSKDFISLEELEEPASILWGRAFGDALSHDEPRDPRLLLR